MKKLFALTIAFSFVFTPIFSAFAQNATIFPWKVPQNAEQANSKEYMKAKELSEKISEMEKKLTLHTWGKSLEDRKKYIAEIDNTKIQRPAITPKHIYEESTSLSKKLEERKRQTENEEEQKLRQEYNALKSEYASIINQNPQIPITIKQGQINDAFDLYKQAANMSRWKNLPQYKKTPAEIQKELSAEFYAFDKKIQQGPAYKSFLALEKEMKRINTDKAFDGIAVSLFTFWALRNLRGINLAKPAASLSFFSKEKIAFYGKKIFNFVAVTSIYAGIDEANLKATQTSFMEMVSRLSFLQDNIKALNKIISYGEKSIFGNSKKEDAIPDSWGDEIDQMTAIRYLYGLKFINLYLAYSDVPYKYDLALLDMLSLFSKQSDVFFDALAEGKYSDEEKPSHIKITPSSSLPQRTKYLINSLERLPPFLKYKKTYYYGMKTKEGETIFQKLNPQFIIRDEKGRLIDCGISIGADMESQSNYYMKIEPVYGPQYDDKDYLFEDINPRYQRCEDIKIMA